MEAASLTAPAGRLAIHGGRLLRLRSDDQLVALFRAGNDEAFRVIHDRYHPRLLAYTRQMLAGSCADAEDALQDVFLRAYGALRADDRPLTLRAWLYRVAHNRCIDQMRRPANQATAELQDGVLAGAGSDPWGELQRRDDLRRLVADVRRLPDQQRSALLMREMEGLAYAELADVLGVSLPAVKSLLVRARIGLVEAREARETACVEIRADLATAHDRGVKADGRSRRHLRECAGCEEYRIALRRVREGFAALGPGPTGWGVLTKLLGLSGAGGGAAATAGGAGGGAAAAGGIAAAGGGAKVAALVCAAAVVGGGAVGASQDLARLALPQATARSTPPHTSSSTIPRPATAAAAPPATAIARPVTRPAPERVSPRNPTDPVADVRRGLNANAPASAAAASWSPVPEDAPLDVTSSEGEVLTAAAAGGALAPGDSAEPDPPPPAPGADAAPTSAVDDAASSSAAPAAGDAAVPGDAGSGDGTPAAPSVGAAGAEPAVGAPPATSAPPAEASGERPAAAPAATPAAGPSAATATPGAGR